MRCKLFVLWFVTASCLVLSACGGGSSSSGGNESNFTPGTYRGTQEININGSDIDERVRQEVIGELAAQGIFTLRQSNGSDILQAAIFRNKIEFTGSASILISADCTGNILLNADILSDRIIGSYSSDNVICDSVPVVVSGNFNLSLES